MQSSTYYPGGSNPAQQGGNVSSVTDTTANTVTTWDISGVQTGQRPLTAAEIAALTPTGALANQATMQQRATNALAANATYLALTTPTTAQTVAQVQRLTRECTAVIRLLLTQVDDTTGT